MITHTSKEKPAQPPPGEIVVKVVRIIRVPEGGLKAELHGSHELKEVAMGDVVDCPIWSARDLVNRKLAEYA